ncbi:MAG: hypothetical protein AB4063_14335 [Crocosphaera sp.]
MRQDLAWQFPEISKRSVQRRGETVPIFHSNNSHTKRYLSRRRFEKMLGVAPTEKSSGRQKSKKIMGGYFLCRKLFWQWIYTRIETPNGRKNNPILRELYDWMKQDKFTGTPIKLLRMKVASHAVRLLFNELVNELT